MNYLELTTALAKIDEQYRGEEDNPYRRYKKNELIKKYNQERRQSNEQKV